MIPKSQLEQMMKDIMELSGEDFEITREDVSRPIKGARNTSKSNNRKYVQFYPGEDIRVGDILTRKVSPDKWLIVEVDPHLVSGEVLSINAYYQTEFERKRQPQAASYIFHNSSNIIAGSQVSTTTIIDIGKIETEIEERGGSDKEELHAMIREIMQSFERQDTIRKGSLARFSETLEKHSWITGSLIQIIGTAAIQYFIK